MTKVKIAEANNPEVKRRALKLLAVHLLLLLILSCFFLFLNLGSYSLKEPDEGRYAEIPREMVETGDYIVPRLNYVRYFEKPPLHYWMTALSYHALGISEWSFRLPNALAALFCVLALYFSTRKWFTARTAFTSAVILLSSFGFFAMGRIITIDMLFTCLLFISLLAFYGYYREKRMGSCYLFYGCLALSTLAKGPVALILVGLTIIIFLVAERNVAFLKDLLRLKGLLLYGCITVPWFIAIALTEKEFLWFFFVDQHFLRFLTAKHKRSGPLYYFIPVLLGGMFPWSLLIPRSIVALWHVKELRLFFIWSLVAFVFFSLSGSKLPPYMLPVFPAISVILGYFFCNRWNDHITWLGEIALYQLCFAVLCLTGLLAASGKLPGLLDLSPKIIDILRETRGLSLGVSILSAVMLLLFCAKNMRRFKTVFVGLVAFSLVIIVLLMLHARVIDSLNTAKELAHTINQQKAKAEVVVVNYGSFDETLPFYIRQRVLIASYQGELAMGATYPDTKDFFLSPEAFVTLFNSGKQVLAVLKESRLARLHELGVRNPTLLGCQGGRCLISNH
jgi:4-amino-4-deoxy-L-arabinose transferase-like glycosyltransferase